MRVFARSAESLAKLREEVDRKTAETQKRIDYERRKKSGELTAEELEAAREGSRRNMIAFYGYDWMAKQAEETEKRLRDYQLPGMAKAEDLDFMLDFAEEAADDDGWDDSMIEFSLRDNEKTARSGGGVLYSQRESYEAAVQRIAKVSEEDYLREKSEHPFVKVMDHTPRAVLDSMNGRSDRQVLIRRDALYLATRESGIQEGHYHGLGVETMLHLGDYLEHPDVIISTNSSDDRRLILTHIPTKNGHAVISVEFDSMKDFERKYDKYNIVITVFDLHKNYLNQLFKKRNAKVLYKNESLAQVNPQLHEWLEIIDAKLSNTNIADKHQNVNTKFSARDSEGRELTEQQREFFKDSKVRDTNGNLMVMYHGTDGDFYEFDAGRNGENTGNGGFYRRCFYFTTSRVDAYNLRPPPAIPLPPLGAVARHRMYHGLPRE